MREIEFRGKEIETGKWFYGSLIDLDEDGVFIALDLHERYDVDPETVGQYTGLKDKNGVKIFEDDIVQQYSYPRKVVDHRGIVEEYCGEDDRTYFVDDSYIVIGNIHDNPELLEAKE